MRPNCQNGMCLTVSLAEIVETYSRTSLSSVLISLSLVQLLSMNMVGSEYLLAEWICHKN